MRSKLILIVSVLILCIVCFVIYRGIGNKDINDYVEDDLKGYDYEMDELDFYAEDSSSIEVIDVSNVMNMLGLEDAVVMQSYIDIDSECDLHYDYITIATDDIDTDKPIFYALDGEDMFYAFYDTSGNIHGVHFDSNMDVVKMV